MKMKKDKPSPLYIKKEKKKNYMCICDGPVSSSLVEEACNCFLHITAQWFFFSFKFQHRKLRVKAQILG